MKTSEALQLCDKAVLAQSLGILFHTLEQEKLGAEALMADSVPTSVQNSLRRLLDSTLLAHKNVHVAACERRREMAEDPVIAQADHSTHIPVVCIL
jgi:hypothetical protein